MVDSQTKTKIDKNRDKALFFLEGEERLLRDEALRYLISSLLPSEHQELNLERLFAAQTDVTELLDKLMTLAFLGQRRVIILEEVDNSRVNNSLKEGLVEYMSNPHESNCLILVADKLDHRSKLYLRIKKRGVILQFPRYKDYEAANWIKKGLKKTGKNISSPALNLLVEKTGNNLSKIKLELEKIVLYIGERNNIDNKDVEAIIGRSKEENIFNFVNAVADRNKNNALNILNNLLEDNKNHFEILALLAWQFRRLLAARDGLDKGNSYDNILREAGVHPYYGKKFMLQVEKFSFQKLFAIFNLLWEQDVSFKSRSLDSKIMLQVLVVKLCSL
jgi:DNA polymerase-3 subunit delta